MKVCTKCNIEKDDSEFRDRVDKGDGRKYLNTECKKCERDRQSSYYKIKKNLPEFMEANRKRQSEYREKNIDDINSRRHTIEYREKHLKLEMGRYYRKKDEINAKAKIKRQTPEYKEYVKSYRLRKKEIISEQEKITKKRYHEKHRDNVTKEYCLRLLRTQGLEINEQSLTQKQIKVLIDRIMKRLADLEKGTFKICIMCNKKKSVKYFKRGDNHERINTCSWCNTNNLKKTKYEKYKRIKKPFI